MAITVSSILKLTVFQALLGQQVLNVQYYRVLTKSDAVITLAGFAEALGGQWYAACRVFQLSALTYVRAVLEEVNGIEFDQYSYPGGSAGAVTTGNSMPPFVCYAVRQNRLTKATRNGQKRFAGVSEEAVTNGSISVAQQTTIADAVEEVLTGTVFLEDALEPLRTMAVEPIIWGGNDPAFPLGRFSRINGITVSPFVTTQNTRKVRTRDGL